ncbi:hypothetical protein R5R35_000570 [Gryllus longicercus]|uniref:Serine/threonine-protein phosphatase 2A activator n=1 Tax=Gryllus longicercus TaxID=2509291 RepID=A0AAN9VFR8_9ORTH
MAAEIDLENHPFMVPKRAVLTIEDMHVWEKSEAYADYLGFIMTLNDAVKGISTATKCSESEVTKGMVLLLDKLDQWIDETPPVEQPQRFGNQAFRQWYSKLKQRCDSLLQIALPAKFHRAVPELNAYLTEGFGNSTRIDYGTGHEMSFLMLLCCCYKIGAFVKEDNVAVVTRVFHRYLTLVRKLQLTYRMEPAGSHGVWSLDDYQFVPFIWGSSQLVAHPRIEPKSFLDNSVVQQYAGQYMFIACIEFINKVKTGVFAEHSNQLWNISGVATWTKINSGLIKMYKAEILGKFPVIQHVLFGSLMTFTATKRPLGGLRSFRMDVTERPPETPATPPD